MPERATGLCSENFLFGYRTGESRRVEHVCVLVKSETATAEIIAFVAGRITMEQAAIERESGYQVYRFKIRGSREPGKERSRKPYENYCVALGCKKTFKTFRCVRCRRVFLCFIKE